VLIFQFVKEIASNCHSLQTTSRNFVYYTPFNCGCRSRSGDVGWVFVSHAWRHGFDTWLGIIVERWVGFIAPCTFVVLQLTQLWMSSCYSNSGER